MCYLQALSPTTILLALAFDRTLSRPNRVHLVQLLAESKHKAAFVKSKHDITCATCRR